MALTGMAMIGLTGMAALAVDLARHTLTANEAQIVADAAAQAGALAFKEGASMNDAAKEVASQNTMAGDSVDDLEIDVALGTFDWDTREFSPGGGEGANAVRATATKDLNNIFAGLLGAPWSTIRRSAVAAIGPASAGRPTLPVALSDCQFPADCQDESCLPTLTQQPNPDDNSGFTGFYEGANTNTYRTYLARQCGGAGRSGPQMHIGDAISLSNGASEGFMKILECSVCELGLNEYVVPIVAHCDENFNRDGTVYGFANITIDSFNYSNGDVGCGIEGDEVGGSPESMNLTAVIRDDEAGVGAGGPCTGCNFLGVSLVL